jgi:ribosomal protein S9
MEINMDSGNAVIGALIFIVLILGANFVMYAIARGAARGGSSNWMNALKQGLSKPLDSQSNKSIDELHQKMEELQKDSRQKDSRQKNSKKEE